jgi:hypothetical protein
VDLELLDEKLATAQRLLYAAETRGANDQYPEFKVVRELLMPVRLQMHQDSLAAMPVVEERPMVGSKLDIMSQAVQQGYTGEFCDQCFGVRMIKTGTCSTCQECGVTTGCS